MIEAKDENFHDASFYLIGGPNGADKTTIALQVLPPLGYYEFVNADALAQALSPFQPESVAL